MSFDAPQHPLADHPLFNRPPVEPIGPIGPAGPPPIGPVPPEGPGAGLPGQGPDGLGDGTGGTGMSGGKRALFIAGWLLSAVAVGGAAGFGILAATNGKSTSIAAPVAPVSTPSPSVTSGVRSDGSHFGTVKDFLIPVPDGFHPGPDAGSPGNDSSITPDQLDSQVSLLFGTLPASDMTSAKGAMEGGHMKDGAVRSYVNDGGSLDFSFTVLQLDPALSAKSTGDFERIVKQSRGFRTGPAVAGHPEALCVLPETRPGDKLDSMTCLATEGDTFAIAVADGTVPLDAKTVTGLFAKQLDVLKNGLGK